MKPAFAPILLFDPGGAILPPRPQFDCAIVSSGGQGWPRLSRPPEGLVLAAVRIRAKMAKNLTDGEEPEVQRLGAGYLIASSIVCSPPSGCKAWPFGPPPLAASGLTARRRGAARSTMR